MCENTEVEIEDTYCPFMVMVDFPDRWNTTTRYTFLPGGEFNVSTIAPDVRAMAATQLRYLADLLAPEKLE